MSKTIVVLTALVPTIGHKFLIDFARNIGPCTVILCCRGKEPVDDMARANALVVAFRGTNVEILVHFDNDDLQNPEGHPNFWDYWVNVVARYVKVTPDMALVASEPYGKDFAAALGCRFIPCDLAREMMPAKSTIVRHNIIGNFDLVLPEFKPHLARRFCLFGQESTGKTTMARTLRDLYKGHLVVEWARPYLEFAGHEVDQMKMSTIELGQFAAMMAVEEQLTSPYIFRDTDLLSTIGYYRIWGKLPPKSLINRFEMTKSDFYFVMNDSVPFEPDLLRYGGDKRESTKEFWIKLLDEFKCNYHVVQKSELDDVIAEIKSIIDSTMRQAHEPVMKFERE